MFERRRLFSIRRSGIRPSIHAIHGRLWTITDDEFHCIGGILNRQAQRFAIGFADLLQHVISPVLFTGRFPHSDANTNESIVVQMRLY